MLKARHATTESCREVPAPRLKQFRSGASVHTPFSPRASKVPPDPQSNIMPADMRQAKHRFVVDKGCYPTTKGRRERHAKIGIVSVRAISRETNGMIRELTLRIIHKPCRNESTIVLELVLPLDPDLG